MPQGIRYESIDVNFQFELILKKQVNKNVNKRS